MTSESRDSADQWWEDKPRVKSYVPKADQEPRAADVTITWFNGPIAERLATCKKLFGAKWRYDHVTRPTSGERVSHVENVEHIRIIRGKSRDVMNQSQKSRPLLKMPAIS